MNCGGTIVNKTELIETLSVRLGDKKAANAALDAVLAEIQNAVTKGDKVSITGFGVFEKRVRAARTARNPRTGEAVKVKKTSVPAFRPGAGFKELVAAGKVPKVAKATSAAKSPVKTVATAPAKKAPAAPVKTVATRTRKAAAAPAPVKATKTVKSAPAAAKKTARAATSTTSRSTAAVPAPRKAPARAARAAK
jgi:DNA-binding protein HU-beta